MNDKWSLGTIIGMPIALLCLLTGVAIIGCGLNMLRTQTLDGEEKFFTFGIGSIIIVATIVATGFAMYPWSSDYHRWHHEHGTITAIDSRLVGAGKDSGVTQRFVVDLKGVGKRSCDDTRCATLKVGDVLDLSCKRAYQWSGTPGWDCNYVAANGDPN